MAGRIMPWRAAAREVGISEAEMFRGIHEGKYPALRVGGSRGRWIVDVDKLQARIDALMDANVRNGDKEAAGGIRRVT